MGNENNAGISGSDKSSLELAATIAPALRMLYSGEGMAIVSFFPEGGFYGSPVSASSSGEPLTIGADADLISVFEAYKAANGFAPEIVTVQGLGSFKITASNKGGKSDLQDGSGSQGRLAGKIAIVTGGAQGFGKGIAEAMAAEGACIAVADLNIDGALICARELNTQFGEDTAIAVEVDVSDEASVRHMVQETVLSFGGLDILISNAGILIAGSLSDLSKDSFELVTKVNYIGYFLCAKYASEPMKIQNIYAPGYMVDIIEINSKSGLEGSNKNSAYAGSKFGGIGLTQSFAMELVEYGIKVNAICPGNLLDGPLWSDPDKGLFRQYLDSGKVEGAKTIDDVRKFYEAKVPMGRGCTVTDVARAIFYIVEQKYETGQAIPVTGGQVMLK